MQRINSKNIKKIIAKLKKNKKKIGLVHGVFDVLHAGHLLYFEEAKKNVDFLIASVTSDKYAMKAPGKPIFGIENRSKVLQSLKSIDYVIESNSPTAVNVINDIKPSLPAALTFVSFFPFKTFISRSLCRLCSPTIIP